MIMMMEKYISAIFGGLAGRSKRIGRRNWCNDVKTQPPEAIGEHEDKSTH